LKFQLDQSIIKSSRPQ